MIDGSNTTIDWQRHPGDVCVLPVGAFEQHSDHMPLATDAMLAEYFARRIAKHLDAALLPCIRIGTSLEHSGFRGSLSLRPETLMQVIRDLVEELSRQRFTIVVLVNFHGGNHCLVPVVRDINRLDGPTKVVHVHPWTFADPSIAQSDAARLDIHAGEFETSLMLAVAPDSVRTATDPEMEADGPLALQQPDLTTFGMGWLAGTGAVGAPSRASADKGERLISSIMANMLPVIDDRIARLRQDPRYCKGGIAMRPMGDGDVDAGMRLKSIAGWNQLPSDWLHYLHENPEGCFVAVHNGRVVGTVTTCGYQGQVAWIGMVLVDPDFRGRRIATMLMNQALTALESCETVKLDATPAGRQVYLKLGFEDEYPLRRLLIAQMPNVPAPSDHSVRELSATDLEAIVAFDTPIFGVERRELLAHYLENHRGLAWGIFDQSGVLKAYCLGRRGANFTHIGPICAEDDKAAMAVTSSVFAALGGSAVGVDVPTAQTGFGQWLEGIGFREERGFTRMYKGPNRMPGRLQEQFAISGPELG